VSALRIAASKSLSGYQLAVIDDCGVSSGIIPTRNYLDISLSLRRLTNCLDDELSRPEESRGGPTNVLDVD
jgi:hypothetical protein